MHRAEAGANLADKAEKTKQAKAAEEAEAKKAEAEKAKQVEAEKAKKAKEAAARKAAEEKAAPAKKNTGPSTEQTALITKVTADQAEDASAKNASAMKVSTKGADHKSAEQKSSGGGTAAAAATAGAAGTAAATRASDVEHKGGQQSASEEFHSPEELEELQRTLGEDEVIEYEDDSISWPALIGQAIAAILVGIGVFLGFKLLWGSLPAVLVLVLALAVTLVLVGVVHALLRHRDKLIMILTFVVGLVLTIGPRLIMSI